MRRRRGRPLMAPARMPPTTTPPPRRLRWWTPTPPTPPLPRCERGTTCLRTGTAHAAVAADNRGQPPPNPNPKASSAAPSKPNGGRPPGRRHVRLSLKTPTHSFLFIPSLPTVMALECRRSPHCCTSHAQHMLAAWCPPNPSRLPCQLCPTGSLTPFFFFSFQPPRASCAAMPHCCCTCTNPPHAPPQTSAALLLCRRRGLRQLAAGHPPAGCTHMLPPDLCFACPTCNTPHGLHPAQPIKKRAGAAGCPSRRPQQAPLLRQPAP